MTSRAVFVSGALLAFAFSFPTTDCLAQAQKGLKNNTDQEWVSRRHKDDWNNNEDIAVVLSIQKEQGQTDEDAVVATIWLYDDVNAAGDKYKLRKKYENLKGTIVHQGGVKRNRETCVLELDAADGIRVWVSLFRNKVNPMGNAPRVHQRVVLRYKEGDYTEEKKAQKGCAQAAAQATAAADDGCDEEPNEDVLEEEDLTTTGGGEPVVPYDP